MDILYYKILLYSLLIILPIIPAVILYKFLPGNKVVVTGPFKGLNVKMAGAFGGYFLLFVGSLFLIKDMIFEKRDRYEVWTVKVDVYDEKGNRLNRDKNKPDVLVTPHPEINNGVLNFKVPVLVDNNYYEFPSIDFSAFSSDDASDLRVPDNLSNDLMHASTYKGEKKCKWTYDYANKMLTFDTVIRLIKVTTPVIESNNILVMDSISK
jgi:hypothetical protein